jgi:hypothetical protein
MNSFVAKLVEILQNMGIMPGAAPAGDPAIMIDQINDLISQVHAQDENAICLAWAHLENAENLMDLSTLDSRVKAAFISLGKNVFVRMRILKKEKPFGNNIFCTPNNRFSIFTNNPVFADNAGNVAYRLLGSSLLAGVVPGTAPSVPIVPSVPSVPSVPIVPSVPSVPIVPSAPPASSRNFFRRLLPIFAGVLFILLIVGFFLTRSSLVDKERHDVFQDSIIKSTKTQVIELRNDVDFLKVDTSAVGEEEYPADSLGT